MRQATNGDHDPGKHERADQARESTGDGAAGGDVDGGGRAGQVGEWIGGWAAGGAVAEAGRAREAGE